MDIADQLVHMFCQIDDFCKEIDQYAQQGLLEGPNSKKRGPDQSLSLSEIMTILIMFHHVRFRDFKTYYIAYVTRHWQREFLDLPSYSRFISIIKQAIFPMTLFTFIHSGKRTGIYYIDSSCLPVPHPTQPASPDVCRYSEIWPYFGCLVFWPETSYCNQ